MKVLLFFPYGPPDDDNIYGGEEITIYCPVCEEFVDNSFIQTEDYVNSNCIIDCRSENPHEMMICPTGIHSDFTLKELARGDDICGRVLSKKDMIKINIPEEYHDTICLEVSIIMITSISYDEIHYNDIPPSPFDSSMRDDMYMYYEGYCPDCNRKYDSYIWDD